tara:strand:+ start:9223 stop:10509 length:1287 start_codon:yes stop_codon:yes gene_type:complete
MKNIPKIRKQIIHNYFKFYKQNLSISDFYNSPFSYPATWSKNSGYYILKSFYNFNILERIKHFIKDFISIGRLSSYKLLINSDLKKKKYKNLYISWARKKDFNNKGIFKNNYLPQFTKKNNLWFILNIDTKKIYSKDYLIWQKETFDKFDFRFLLVTIFQIVLKNRFNLRKIYYSINVDTVFSNMVYKELSETIQNYKIKKIFLPYEAQPFQKNLLSKIKRKNKKIKFIGFLNAIQPFPIHLHHFSDLVDVCYTISPSQRIQLTKIFGWNKKKLILIKSDKFKSRNVNNYKNQIILPFYITNFKKILLLLENLIKNKPTNYFCKFNVRPHPAGLVDKNYRVFTKQIKLILRKFRKKFNNSKQSNKCLIVGSTSSIIEALEKKLIVYHLVDQPELESLDKYLWPNVNITQINDNIFKYTIKKTKSLINY